MCGVVVVVVVVVVVEAFDRGVLDRAVYPLDLAIDPRALAS